jgi:hypothetical protein
VKKKSEGKFKEYGYVLALWSIKGMRCEGNHKSTFNFQFGLPKKDEYSTTEQISVQK